MQPFNEPFYQAHRTLRLFISNTTSDQSSTMEDENAFDLNNGNVPSWTLKIEGRLLDVRSNSTGQRQYTDYRDF